jgi:hypothetical protein
MSGHEGNPGEARRHSNEDFRSVRQKLPPEAFAIGPEREPDPTDLIDASTWSIITSLPDDVALRTSDHHGTTLRHAYDLWSHWPGLTLDLQSLVPDPKEDGLALASLTVSDELQASLYSALTGFYRQAISGLRPALEATMAGAYFRAFGNQERFTQWADGHRGGELWMNDVRRELAAVAPYNQFEDSQEGIPFLSKSGWVNFIYQRLSTFSHGRPQYTDEDGNQVPTDNVGLWGGSNGPVYEPRSVRLWSVYYFDIGLMCLLLIGLAQPSILRHPKPNDLPYFVLADKAISWHHGPSPPARKIVRFLSTYG